MIAFAGATPTDATGAALTLIVAVPLCPSLVPVIVTDSPTLTPVTSPVSLTVATAVLVLAHVTVRPVRALPAVSLSVAVSCAVDPTVILALAGVTLIEATGT
jgi:hypothetical protein